MAYWLFKSEPSEFSIDDLAAQPQQTEAWDGVRNYQVRNMMRDDMQLDDLALFYHSNTTPPGIAGIVKITRTAYPDPTAFDPDHQHYDPKSDPDQPRWLQVDVTLVRKLKRFIPLAELRAQPELAELALLRRGNRLSIMPVTFEQWQAILALEQG